MFGFNSSGSSDPKNQDQIEDEKINFNEDNFKMDDILIHTMKNDLEELKNPTHSKSSSQQEFFPEKTSPLQNNGPFFQKETPPKEEKNEAYVPKIAQPKKEFLYFDETKELPKEITNEKKSSTKQNQNISQSVPPIENHGIGKAIIIAFIVFILLIASAGGYYFWMTRIVVPSDQAISLDEPKINLPEENEIPTTSTLSSTNLNYLQINLTQTNPGELKKVLNNYADEVSKTNEIGVFKFLITDETNTPITFQDFSTVLGINLSPETSAQIDQDFTLYIYNYGDITRFGLILNTLNDSLLKNALLKEESNLFLSLLPLYPENLNSPSNTNFSPIIYKNYTVRYLNITSPEDYAIDYTINNNQLFIGTTKTTLFSALDQLSEQAVDNLGE